MHAADPRIASKRAKRRIREAAGNLPATALGYDFYGQKKE
jgi:hypothetical protein